MIRPFVTFYAYQGAYGMLMPLSSPDAGETIMRERRGKKEPPLFARSGSNDNELHRNENLRR